MSWPNTARLQLASEKAVQGAAGFPLQQSLFSANTWISFYLRFRTVQRIIMSANMSKPPFSNLFKEYIYKIKSIPPPRHNLGSSLIQSLWDSKSPCIRWEGECALRNGIQINTWTWICRARGRCLVWEPCVCAVIFALCFQIAAGDFQNVWASRHAAIAHSKHQTAFLPLLHKCNLSLVSQY